MLRYVEVRCGAVRGVHTKNIREVTYILLMSFLRIKHVKKKNGKKYSYLVRQTNVRKGDRVHSIMEHIGAVMVWIPASAASPGRPGGFSGNRPTDQRHIRHQDEADRELFHKHRGRFNVKQGQDYDRQQKARDYAKEAREAKMSRSERRERDVAKEAAQKKWDEGKEAVKEFNEARAAEASRSGSEPSAK
jgi:hypothetical protein